MQASQVAAADLARLAGTQAVASGVVKANILLYGSQLSPRGQGRVLLSKASILGEELQKAELKFQGAGESVAGTIDLGLPAGSVHGEWTYYPKQLGYTASLQAANFQLDRFNASRVRKLGIAGALRLEAKGTGTLLDPAFEATVSVPDLRIQDRHLRDVRMQANVKNHVATVDLNSEAAQTGLHRDPTDEAFLAPLIAKARSALGTDAFNEAESRGRLLSYEDAMAEAQASLDASS